MDLPDQIPDAAKELGSKLGKPPGSRRWEIITALFGWGACVSLVGWFLASILGFSEIASYAVGAFSFLFAIAFKRDVAKLLMTGRMTK